MLYQINFKREGWNRPRPTELKLQERIGLLVSKVIKARDKTESFLSQGIQVQREFANLNKREGKAQIELAYVSKDDLFARETLRVIDFGVSDNVYVVESDILSKLHKTIQEQKIVIESQAVDLEQADRDIAQMEGR